MERDKIIKQWEEAVSRQLGGLEGTALNKEVYPGIVGNALAHHQNAPVVSGLLALPTAGMIGVRFGEKAGNEKILEALNLGAESIDVQIREETDVMDLLNEVQLNLITPIFRCSSPKAEENLRTYFQQAPPLYSSGEIICNGDLGKSDLRTYVLLNKYDGEDKIEEVVYLCRSARESQHDRLAVELTIGENYFFEIARIRALRIVLANIFKDKSDPTPIKIIGRVVTKDNSKDALIAQTSMALSAFLGGASIVQINEWDHTGSDLDRLSLHIQNILVHESSIRREKDAVAGSYYVEDLTEKTAQMVWDKLEDTK